MGTTLRYRQQTPNPQQESTMGNALTTGSFDNRKMQRMVLSKPSKDMADVELKVEEVHIPLPEKGQVLIKVEAAPVNPSDYGRWLQPPPSGTFAPQPIGNEGSGVVVMSGGGLLANRLVGKNVGFVGLPKGQGSYSEYVTADAATSVYPLPASVDPKDAASFFVNPYTAVGILDTVRGFGAKSFIHTGAASQLGQMLIKLTAQKNDITILNVVRREEQADMLRRLGAQHVVVSGKEGWKDELKRKVDELKISVAFDAVSGELSGDLMDVLPPKGKVYVYGALSSSGPSGFKPTDMIYQQKKVEGWLLTHWIKEGRNPIGIVMNLRKASALVNEGLEPGGWATTQFIDCGIANMWSEFLPMYQTSGFTNKKLRIVMDQSVGASG